jgi:hypothetical protein
MKNLIALCFVLALAGCASLAEMGRAARCSGEYNTPECHARAQADNDAYYARKQQRDADTWAQVQRNQSDLDAYVASRQAVSDGIVSNAMARNAFDTARVAAPAPTVRAPAAPIVDPLAPNSAMQAEAAQARKGAGTDLCPTSISDIECANRLQWLQEQARGQH